MTIKELLDAVDQLKPNQYTYAQKIVWLKALDGMIWNKIKLFTGELSDREPDPETYTEELMETTELLLTDPYTEIYTWYVFAMIDVNNGETLRYENDMVMYNTVLNDFLSAYTRDSIANTNFIKVN